MMRNSFHPQQAVTAPSYALTLTSTEQESLNFLLPLSDDYPHFHAWYMRKVVPGLRAGTRTMMRLERHDSLVGIGIAKQEENEQKICTVRVLSSYFGRGYGLKLFDGLLRSLTTTQPHLTVSEKKLPAFERIFDYYGFKQSSAQLGRYVPDVTEYSYNDAGKMFK